ncbi:MAG: U32 family peptidase [Clostridia bacterium]|nr:U32 family peptidase [Clostridia bacterium]
MSGKRHSLLSPAGDITCLKAAVKAGADAVYFGVGDTNARCYAENFTVESAKEAVRYCRFFGVESDITLNISVYDREFAKMISTAEELYLAGADAFIVADPGLAAELKKRFPDIVLHASTQAMGHSAECAAFLGGIGFSRMVLARELSGEDIKAITLSSPIESEIFVHGACCASASGSCLLSAAIGGRSGNRGKCAGPCRLPYRMEGKEGRLLSLSDLCCAGHMEELLKLDIAAFKIEGRMKPPEYVYGVTRIYRTLIDENRNAGEDELALLQRYFSRPFSDAYFLGRSQPASGEPKKSEELPKEAADCANSRSASVSASFKANAPFSVTAVCGECSFTAEGPVPEPAKNAPLTEDKLKQQLKKAGGTPFSCEDVSIDYEPLFLPVSQINDTRRRAYEGLYGVMTAPPERAVREVAECAPDSVCRRSEPARYAFFANAAAVGDVAREYFDRIYIPLYDVFGLGSGVGAEICPYLPPVIHPSEEDDVRAALSALAKRGFKHAAVSNPGHIGYAKAEGFSVLCDIGANVFNEKTARLLLGYADEATLSPELGTGALSDICEKTGAGYTVYGRLPLMILQSCIIRQTAGCAKCAERRENGDGFFTLRDRTGARFPVRGSEHRSVLYNSVPIYMGDKEAALPECGFRVWRFTCESKNRCDKIVSMYKEGRTPDLPCMRIQKYNLEARNEK